MAKKSFKHSDLHFEGTWKDDMDNEMFLTDDEKSTIPKVGEIWYTVNAEKYEFTESGEWVEV